MNSSYGRTHNMRYKLAVKLHNRDEVEVKINGKWENGYLLGEPFIVGKLVYLPVQSIFSGYNIVSHFEVR